MTMNCPVCKNTPLQPTVLEQELKASSCDSCQGQWISAMDYWQWLDHHGETLPEKEPDSIPLEVADHQKAKLCPECRRIMLRYKVGHGLAFTLDQCSSCNGIWFDVTSGKHCVSGICMMRCIWSSPPPGRLKYDGRKPGRFWQVSILSGLRATTTKLKPSNRGSKTIPNGKRF